MNRRLSLSQAILFAVVAALVPIAIFSIAQALSVREYAQQLIAERLITSALATSATQNEPILNAQRVLGNFQQDPDVVSASERCQAILAAQLTDQFVNFGFSNAQGYVQCSALPFTGSVYNGGETWWRQGVSTGRFTLSTPTIGKISKRRLIAAMQPLLDQDGRFMGALTAGIDASWIEKALARRKLSRNAIVAIVGPDGKTLMTGDDRALPRVDLEKSFGRAATVTADDGSQWMYASAPLYARQLYVVYAEPKGTLLSTARDQFRVSILLPILTIIFSCAAIFWAINRFVLRWLRSISGLSRQFAFGRYEGDEERFRRAPAEIAALSSDLHNMARVIEDRDTDLRIAAATTKAMAREVNHRVKNNLQMVMSLLSLQAGQLKDPDAKDALDQTRLRMAAMSLIHRLMYEDARSERGEVDISRLIDELCTQLRNDFDDDRVVLECRSTLGVMSIDQAIPLMLLIVEAVTNAYRHAFPADRHGRISVTLRQEGADRVLHIADDGVGYDSAGSIDRMGLELMHAFAAQLGGALSIDGASGQGVRTTLSFPTPAVEKV